MNDRPKEMDVKLVSSLALAAALVSAVVAVPAFAKEKPAVAPASPLQDLSKEFRIAAQPVQKALQAKVQQELKGHA